MFLSIPLFFSLSFFFFFFFIFYAGIGKSDRRVDDTSMTNPYVLFNEANTDGTNSSKFVFMFVFCMFCLIFVVGLIS